MSSIVGAPFLVQLEEEPACVPLVLLFPPFSIFQLPLVGVKRSRCLKKG